jgi:hypothetical protein
VEEAAKHQWEMPAEAGPFAVAEIYHGDEAVLMMIAAGGTRFDDVAPLRFTRKDRAWVLAEDNDPVRADQLVASRSTDPNVRIVRRQAGIPFERMPQFILYLLSDRHQKFRAAEDRQDFRTCASIVDEMMAGFSLGNLADLVRTLHSGRDVRRVSLASKVPQPDGRVLASFVIESEEPGTFRYFLAKEGSGWVIDEAYGLRGRKTEAAIRSVAVAIEAYSIDHGEVYPAATSLEQLKDVLQPTYIRTLPVADAWGTPIRYEVADKGKRYRLVSAGADRKFDPASWTVANLDLVNLDDDLVFENGTFVRQWQMSN